MHTMLKYMQVNTNPIWCSTHTQNHITHMCCAKTCFQPLCAKCIREHINFHKVQRSHPEIETLEDLHEICTDKIRTAIVNFGNEYAKLEQMSKNLPFSDDEGIKLLRRHRARVIELIEHYFVELEERYATVLAQTAQNYAPIIDEYLAKTDKILKKLDNLDAELESKDPFLTIQLIVQQDFDREYSQFVRDLDKALGKILHGPQLITNNEKVLENINRELAKFVNIQYAPLDPQTSPYYSNKGLNTSYNNLNSPISQNQVKPQYKSSPEGQISYGGHSFRSQKPDQSFHSQRPDQSFHSQKPEYTTMSPLKSKIDQWNYVINVKDSFDPMATKKYLHFFQHKSNYLHLLDLDYVETTGKCEFERVELNINFKIPRWHRSIITPFSEIYLTGGVDAEDTEMKLANSYVYDFAHRTLVAISPMIVGRSGHAMAYMNGHIYVVGGFSEEGEFSDKCERYNIRQNFWTPIASTKLRSNNSACCVFRNKYIYKFGGKMSDIELCNAIERYDPARDEWKIIEYELPFGGGYDPKTFNILSSLACVQINHYEIMIFGGTRADYSVKSNECWLLSVEEDDSDNTTYRSRDLSAYHRVRGLGTTFLPYAEGFWNNQPIIYKKRLFCLQNVPNEKNESVVYLDRRRALMFDESHTWKVLS